MKNRHERDLEVAAQMDIDATLDVVQSKELLHKSIDDEVVAVDDSTAAAKKVASSKEKLADSVVDETDAIREDATVTKRLATAKKKNAERVRANTKANDNESTVSGDLTVARKQRLKTEKKLNDQQPLIDYTPKLNEYNSKLAEELLKKINGLKTNSRASSKETTIYDKFNKQAEKEYAHRYGLFRRINKSLEKTAKKSESGMARMGSKAMLGAGSFIGDKVDDFMKDIPLLGTAYKGAKFVKSSMRDASETKTKRLVRERAHELRTGGSGKDKPSPLAGMMEGRKEREKQNEAAENKEQNKETNEKFDKMIDILSGIRQAQMLGTIMGMLGNLTSGLIGGMTNVMSKLVAGPLSKIGAGIATAVGGMAAAKAMIPAKTPDIDVDTQSKEKTKYKDRKKPSAKAPKVSRPEIPTTSAKDVKKGAGPIIKRVLGSVAKNPAKFMFGMGARLLGPVGLAYTAYEIADSFGAVDAAKDFLSENLGQLFGGGEEGQVESGGLDMETPEADRSSQIDDAMESARDDGRGRLDGWNEDEDAPRITNSGRVILPDEKVEFEPGEKFVSGTFAEVDKIVEAERKRKDAEQIQQAAQATAGAMNSTVNNTSVTNINGGGGSSAPSSVIPSFGNEYQTPHQKGSMIQR